MRTVSYVYNNQNCNMFESSKVYSQVQAWFWMFYLENDLMNSLIQKKDSDIQNTNVRGIIAPF